MNQPMIDVEKNPLNPQPRKSSWSLLTGQPSKMLQNWPNRYPAGRHIVHCFILEDFVERCRTSCKTASGRGPQQKLSFWSVTLWFSQLQYKIIQAYLQGFPETTTFHLWGKSCQSTSALIWSTMEMLGIPCFWLQNHRTNSWPTKNCFSYLSPVDSNRYWPLWFCLNSTGSWGSHMAVANGEMEKKLSLISSHHVSSSYFELSPKVYLRKPKKSWMIRREDGGLLLLNLTPYWYWRKVQHPPISRAWDVSTPAQLSRKLSANWRTLERLSFLLPVYLSVLFCH